MYQRYLLRPNLDRPGIIDEESWYSTATRAPPVTVALAHEFRNIAIGIDVGFRIFNVSLRMIVVVVRFDDLNYPSVESPGNQLVKHDRAGREFSINQK